jgi:hypothetical protein
MMFPRSRCRLHTYETPVNVVTKNAASQNVARAPGCLACAIRVAG